MPNDKRRIKRLSKKAKKKKAYKIKSTAIGEHNAWKKSGASNWSAPITGTDDTSRLMNRVANVIRFALREEDQTVVVPRKTDKTAFMIVVIYHVKGIEFCSATLHTAYDKAYLKVKGFEFTFFKKELKEKLLDALKDTPDLFHLPDV